MPDPDIASRFWDLTPAERTGRLSMTDADKAGRTKGPWRLPRNGEAPDAMLVCDPEGGSIADTAPPGPWMTVQEAAANAAAIVEWENNYDSILAENKRLREALEPFAREAKRWTDKAPDDFVVRINLGTKPDRHSEITVGDLRRARSALTKTTGAE